MDYNSDQEDNNDYSDQEEEGNYPHPDNEQMINQGVTTRAQARGNVRHRRVQTGGPIVQNIDRGMNLADQGASLLMSVFFKLVFVKFIWAIAGALSFWLFCYTVTNVLSHAGEIQQGLIWVANFPTHVKVHQQNLVTNQKMKDFELESKKNHSNHHLQLILELNQTMFDYKNEKNKNMKTIQEFMDVIKEMNQNVVELKALRANDEKMIKKLISDVGVTQQAMIAMKTDNLQKSYLDDGKKIN